MSGNIQITITRRSEKMNKNEQEQINSSCLMFANMAGLDFQR
nr:MAG TPA: hypothetical protein [Caudoviricetes sp.]